MVPQQRGWTLPLKASLGSSLWTTTVHVSQGTGKGPLESLPHGFGAHEHQLKPSPIKKCGCCYGLNVCVPSNVQAEAQVSTIVALDVGFGEVIRSQR